MSDLIDKIARDRAQEMVKAIYLTIEHNATTRPIMAKGLEEMLKSAMREAVRLSGGKMPELQSEK